MKSRVKLSGIRRRGTSAILAASLVASAMGAAVTSSTASAAKSRYGGTLTVGVPNIFAGFCFTTTSLVGMPLGAISSVLEPLFTKDTKGNAVGYLAQSATPSADFKTWTIALRPGISYSNGQPFNADSVIENMDYARGAAYLTGGASKAWTLSTGIAAGANILGEKKIDDLTVEVDLFRPQNDLPLALTYSYMRASESLATSQACVNNPIGTGAFTLATWSTTSLNVVRNPNYWRTDPNRPGTKLPYLDSISFVRIQEGSTRAAAVRKGSVDIAYLGGGSDATFIKDLKLRKSVVTVRESPISLYTSIWLNQGNGGPFADINARQAVVHCIDRANYVKVRMRGTGEAAKSIAGSSNVLYNPAGFPKFDIAASKGFVTAYLTAHPEKSNLSFTVPFAPDTLSQGNAAFLKATFEKCGITMNVDTQEAAVWAVKAFNPLTGQNAYDMLVTPLITESDAAVNFPLLVTNAFPADSTNPLKIFRSTVGAVLSATHHNDTTVDDLWWQARSATTPAAVKAAYSAVAAELQNQAIITGLCNYAVDLVTYNKAKVNGIGTLQFVKGTPVRPVTYQGADWAGLYKG